MYPRTKSLNWRVMGNKTDGTGELYKTRASTFFLVRGSIGLLTNAIHRSDAAGVLTSIERMQINSAIVSLESVIEGSSRNWSNVVKPRLVKAIEAGIIVPVERLPATIPPKKEPETMRDTEHIKEYNKQLENEEAQQES